MGMCDVCKEEVEYKDDASILEAIATDRAAVAFFGSPRHIRCSPSRAQYIVHEDFAPMVDDRESFDKRLIPEYMQRKNEKMWTDAFVILQKEERSS
jgi:hypothetical protein